MIIVYLIIQKNPEISKLLQYSQNIPIRKLKKEKEDFTSMDKETLLKKFHLID